MSWSLGIPGSPLGVNKIGPSLCSPIIAHCGFWSPAVVRRPVHRPPSSQFVPASLCHPSLDVDWPLRLDSPDIRHFITCAPSPVIILLVPQLEESGSRGRRWWSTTQDNAQRCLRPSNFGSSSRSLASMEIHHPCGCPPPMCFAIRIPVVTAVPKSILTAVLTVPMLVMVAVHVIHVDDVHIL